MAKHTWNNTTTARAGCETFFQSFYYSLRRDVETHVDRLLAIVPEQKRLQAKVAERGVDAVKNRQDQRRANVPEREEAREKRTKNHHPLELVWIAEKVRVCAVIQILLPGHAFAFDWGSSFDLSFVISRCASDGGDAR